jgi:5-formyltetrahydrofolate cyclo-ligase
VTTADPTRGALRAELRALRRAVSPAERHAAALAAARRLRAAGLPRAGSRLGLYLATREEFSTSPLIDLAHERGCAVYVPVIADYRAHRMRFARLDVERGSPLSRRRNRYGIEEPLGTDALGARWLDLVIVPLVAFSLSSEGAVRVGMGGGYYDRSFAFLRLRSAWQRPRLLGLAYECQAVTGLAAARWDVPLWGVLTERRLYRTDD